MVYGVGIAMAGPNARVFRGAMLNLCAKLWPSMSENEKLALEMLNEIDRARSFNLSMDDLEQRLWRLLDQVDEDFPKILAGKVENLVQEIRHLQNDNLRTAHGRDVDPNQGAEVIFNELTNALGRFAG